MVSVYQLKPAFQKLLRPLVVFLFRMGVTPNQVTFFATIASIAVGVVTIRHVNDRMVYLVIPAFLFVRMALNAVDGMLAREHQMQTPLGAFLNELGDVISDVALYAPFAWIVSVKPWLIGLFLFFSVLTEFAGVVAVQVGAKRNYAGPMGKSDRAFCFGLLSLLWSMDWIAVDWLNWVIGSLAGLALLTVANRIRLSLSEISVAD